MSEPVRTLVVDDHALVTAGLAALLPERSDGRIEIAATATRASEAADLAVEQDVGLAIVDLRMPEPGGIHVIEQIHRRLPGCRIVAVSGEGSPELVHEALLAGAVAFLPKTLDPGELVHPLLTILGGGSVIPPGLLEDLAQARRDRDHLGAGPQLDDSQRKLLALLVAGHETSVIADRLFVSSSTVKRHLSALEEQLDTDSRVSLAFLAGWHRLVTPADDVDARPEPDEQDDIA